MEKIFIRVQELAKARVLIDAANGIFVTKLFNPSNENVIMSRNVNLALIIPVIISIIANLKTIKIDDMCNIHYLEQWQTI